MSLRNTKNVQEVSKQKKAQHKAKWPKTDTRHWVGRVFRNTYTRDGQRHETADWCVKLGHQGKRETFNLGTPNADAAAARALKIYRVIVGSGWDAAIAEFKPDTKPAESTGNPSQTTVGQLIEAAARLSPARWESLETYSQALRRIASAVNGWEGGKEKFSQEGSKAWRAKVDAVTLASITPAAVEEWRIGILKSTPTPEERNAAVVTTNSLIRNSRALVSRKIKSKLNEIIKLPAVLWFHDIALETPPPLRYRSKIDAGTILKAAMEELASSDTEALKCLFLTLVCGLRRSEADTLLWEQIDLNAGTLEVMDTVHKRLKSRGSAGEIALDAQVVQMMKEWNNIRRGPFVLEAVLTPGGKERKQQFRRYRANPTHVRLLAWLRSKGVPGPRPIHLMRKEVGSVIASRDGIFAASRFLRHSDISITAKTYADTKANVSSGLGSLLVVGGDGPAKTSHEKSPTASMATTKAGSQ